MIISMLHLPPQFSITNISLSLFVSFLSSQIYISYNQIWNPLHFIPTLHLSLCVRFSYINNNIPLCQAKQKWPRPEQR